MEKTNDTGAGFETPSQSTEDENELTFLADAKRYSRTHTDDAFGRFVYLTLSGTASAEDLLHEDLREDLAGKGVNVTWLFKYYNRIPILEQPNRFVSLPDTTLDDPTILANILSPRVTFLDGAWRADEANEYKRFSQVYREVLAAAGLKSGVPLPSEVLAIESRRDALEKQLHRNGTVIHEMAEEMKAIGLVWLCEITDDRARDFAWCLSGMFRAAREAEAHSLLYVDDLQPFAASDLIKKYQSRALRSYRLKILRIAEHSAPLDFRRFVCEIIIHAANLGVPLPKPGDVTLKPRPYDITKIERMLGPTQQRDLWIYQRFEELRKAENYKYDDAVSTIEEKLAEIALERKWAVPGGSRIRSVITRMRKLFNSDCS